MRWNPDQEDEFFLTQAGTLSAYYYYTQFAVHRPFMDAARRESPLSFPSLAICTNAARSASHILDAFLQKGLDSTPLTYIIAFVSGTVLLISIWGVRKSGLNVDVSSQIADVQRCIKMLSKSEAR